MTDYDEEQASELETLASIYPEGEFTEVSKTPPCFQISVEVDDDVNSMSVDVQFTYPPTYPEVVPEISVISHSGISEEQMSEIETHLLSVAEENVGMVMIFTLVSAVQDRLSELLDFIKMEKERLELEKAEELERIEKARFFGTTITTENFLGWRKKFNEEMKTTKNANLPSQSTGLTGRQMFEKDASLALSDAKFLTEASELADTDPLDNVEVDESLFQDIEDLQI